MVFGGGLLVSILLAILLPDVCCVHSLLLRLLLTKLGKTFGMVQFYQLIECGCIEVLILLILHGLLPSFMLSVCNKKKATQQSDQGGLGWYEA